MSTWRRTAGPAALGLVLLLAAAPSADAQADRARQAAATTLTFGGSDYLHRWSKDGQNEFTPQGQEDLAKWIDMLTINVHESVRDGDQLAGLANVVLGNYQRAGKIVRTDSKPRTPARPAEHLAVALLGGNGFLEAAFARFVLIDGVGFVVVYSHRAYGNGAANEMGQWLQSNGPSRETVLMAWEGVPALALLKQLPQNTGR
jgi:hypothetical protein